MIIFENILLIDDDEVSNYLTVEIIKEINVSQNIGMVADGEKGFEYLMNHSVDLILLDLAMPNINGIEFLDIINAENMKIRKNTKVIILTNFSTGGNMERLRKRKIDGFIVKPITKEKLEGVLKML